jgi:hypothetical protein
VHENLTMREFSTLCENRWLGLSGSCALSWTLLFLTDGTCDVRNPRLRSMMI